MAEASADVRERYGWPLKTADPQGFVGSNPTPSAKTALERHGFELASVADDWVHQCGPRVGHRSRIRARAMGSLRCTRFHTEVMNICSGDGVADSGEEALRHTSTSMLNTR